ncbi:MAG: SpoIIE family protein phosphatase [Kineosporiaceae bacterium]
MSDAARLRRPFFHESVASAEADFPSIGLHLATAGVQALACLPLSGRGGTVLGTLVLTWTEPRLMSEEERDFLLTTALHCGQALERAQLFEQQQTVTDALQRAVLPDRLPDVAGWELAARYVPATSGLEVGGDWYDAFVLPDGRLGLAVGDASGHGLPAARLMSTLRNALRAYAVLGNGPADVVGRLGTMLEVLDPQAMATVVYFEVDTETGETSWASAGHPPPLWCRTEGPDLTLADDPDPPLGCRIEPGPQQFLATLDPGEALLLYTDGLVERRDESLDVGLDRLTAAARAHAGAGEDPAHAVLDAVVGEVLGGRGSGDDMCAVILRRSRPPGTAPGGPSPATEAAPRPWHHAIRTLHPRPQAAGEARRLVRGWLAEWGTTDVEDAALLVISEMVTNAVTHAEGLVTVEASVDGEVLRLAVTDASHAMPRLERAGPGEEHGRGVDLVDMLSRAWGTDPLAVGKRVWAELSLG